MLQVQADSGLYTDCITSTSFSTATDTDKHPVCFFFFYRLGFKWVFSLYSLGLRWVVLYGARVDQTGISKSWAGQHTRKDIVIDVIKEVWWDALCQGFGACVEKSRKAFVKHVSRLVSLRASDVTDSWSLNVSESGSSVCVIYEHIQSRLCSCWSLALWHRGACFHGACWKFNPVWQSYNKVLQIICL